MADKYIAFTESDGDLINIKALEQGDGSFSIAFGDRDQSTDAIQTIDYAHHEVHSGVHFMYTDATTLGANASQDYLITTPNTTKWAHMIFYLDGSAITRWGIYEGSDKVGIATSSTFNNNRNSLTTAGVIVHKGATAGTTDGTIIHVYKGGSATNQAKDDVSTSNTEEIILKQNVKYILRVTSGTADNLTNAKLEWYEHTAKA